MLAHRARAVREPLNKSIKAMISTTSARLQGLIQRFLSLPATDPSEACWHPRQSAPQEQPAGRRADISPLRSLCRPLKDLSTLKFPQHERLRNP